MNFIAPHIPVLVNEVLANLKVNEKVTILDGTFGCGGHSRLILDHYLKLKVSNTKLFCSDRDSSSYDYFYKLTNDYSNFNIIFGNYNFSQWFDWLKQFHCLDTILIDLGVSSLQLDSPNRGFSFSYDGPLDMRMDQTRGITACEIINTMKEDEIADLIYNYGEENYAKSIARAIVNKRSINEISTTSQLSSIVSSVKKSRGKRHPATKTFQAFRIYINNEFNEIISAIDNALKLLKLGGRLLVITFHGLEVRIIRNYIKNLKTKNTLKLISKLKPTYDEIKLNSRSRSAMLFVFEVVSNKL